MFALTAAGSVEKDQKTGVERVRRTKALKVETKQRRSADALEGKHEGLERDTDREGWRGDRDNDKLGSNIQNRSK